MPENELKEFTDRGYFTVCRSNKPWTGVFCDQTIEQCLMRSLKVTEGLTHGCGIAQSTLAKWVFALPRCIPICNALEKFTGTEGNSSEQHKDLRSSSEKKDNEDISTFIKWLEMHPPFSARETDELISLASGVIADNSVNCDEAVRFGKEAMEKMVSTSENFSSVSLHRKSKVKPLYCCHEKHDTGSR